MSLDLLQGYSSPEAEEEDEDERHLSYSLSDDEDEGRNNDDDEVKSSSMRNNRSKEEKKPPPPSDSSLPSALDAFAEIAGPPEFLTNAVGGVEETREVLGVLDWRGRDRSKRDRKDLPVGAVVEAKAQLVGIRDRVRSDIGGGSTNSDSVTTASGESKRVITAANPGPKDAADLLRYLCQVIFLKSMKRSRRFHFWVLLHGYFLRRSRSYLFFIVICLGPKVLLPSSLLQPINLSLSIILECAFSVVSQRHILIHGAWCVQSVEIALLQTQQKSQRRRRDQLLRTRKRVRG
ncbi:uncharacterized protein [Typha angustifolia]|uniref:uncharacterized protein isoform X1 n=1 Tax=Typha angustifolia TaxID=59011 RepID=UPI003C2EF822